MNEWQRTFLQKLEAAKKQWTHRFEQFAADTIEPVFLTFQEFCSANGFRVSQPPCEPGHRIYKFALTENGYLMMTFRMCGLEELEVHSEAFVPGLGSMDPIDQLVSLCDATEHWVEARFQGSLDQFIADFAEAGELVTA